MDFKLFYILPIGTTSGFSTGSHALVLVEVSNHKKILEISPIKKPKQ